MNIPIHSDCIALPEIGLCRIYKIGRLCIGTANVRAKNIASDQICVCLELPNSYKPIQTLQGLTVENVGFPEKSRVFAVYQNGGIFIFRTQNLASNYVLCFQYFTA